MNVQRLALSIDICRILNNPQSLSSSGVGILTVPQCAGKMGGKRNNCGSSLRVEPLVKFAE
jgi:hypothetical protein